MLLVAAAVLFLVWARSQQKGFHLPGGDGVAITIAGGWAMLLLIWRLFDKPDIQGAGATMGIQWGIFGAMLAAGALIVAGARVRALHAPEPPNPAADDRLGLAGAARARADAGPAAPRRHRGDRDAARPSWEGDARGAAGPVARRARSRHAARRPLARADRRLGDEPTTRLPDDPSREETSRLFDDPSRADTDRLDEKPTTPDAVEAHAARAAGRTARARSGTTTGADAPPSAPRYRSSACSADDRGREPLSRLHLPDRRARARTAPVLHAHDARRVRASGRHAGLGRPQRRRHRQGPRRTHLHRRRRPATSCASTPRARASRSTHSRRAGAPPRPGISRTSSRRPRARAASA